MSAQIRYWTPPQLAKLWGIHPDKVRGWIYAGHLVAIDVSDGDRPRWRISDDARVEFEKQRAVVSPTSHRRSAMPTVEEIV